MSRPETIASRLERLAADDSLRAQDSFAGVADEWVPRLEAQGLQLYRGKVRDMILGPEFAYMVHSDRLTAFDRYIGMVPYKGMLLASINADWLTKVQDRWPNHLIDRPHERILRVHRLEPIKIEVIVRGYLAGSMMRAYLEGRREFCGVTLPDGLKAYQALPSPLITPTTKAETHDHDEETSPEELISSGTCNSSEWNQIAEQSLALFKCGQEIYREHGWILVDTKYEFGRGSHGPCLIDEIHTPDSSRLWDRDSYEDRCARGEPPEMFDKENVRRHLLSLGFSGDGEVPPVEAKHFLQLAITYLRVAERLAGRELGRPSQPVDDWLDDLLHNLGKH